MIHNTLGRAAFVSLALGTATIGCTPSSRIDRVAALSDGAANSTAAAARAAAKAHDALDRHDAPRAVEWAERAVAASPNDADHRMLLGQSYLAAGRFASAEAILRDTLALMPDQPRAGFDLALAQIARGAPDEARATLATAKGHVPDADLGLALALAGDHPGGIAVLTDLIRSGKSDPRARQNLALVFALDNQWGQARGLAMQDTPPERLDAKLAGWAALAKQPSGADQVATMLGVKPALGDPGRPVALALAAPTAQTPVALAVATPMAPVLPQAVAVTAPVRVVALPLEAPVVSAPAPVAVAMAVPSVVPSVPARVPVLLAPVAIARIAAAPVMPPPRYVRIAGAATARAPGPLLVRETTTPGFVVQLGAFARAAALDDAWSRAARLSPRFASFSAVRGSTQHRGGTLVRLSIGGFGGRSEATRVCAQIKARGGACFVRGALDDRPWQWAKADAPTQIAMR